MSTALRKGKTKYLVEKSIESALLAVETYNSPRKDFRFETYIVLMIIALTKLFHAHFNHTLGDKYYYKNANGRYKQIDGERKTWELKTCIEKYGKLNEAVKCNFNFFIRFRNKIEHSSIDQSEVGKMIFGECQSLLFNYENLLVKLFGSQYAINESLAFSLQFSLLRTDGQRKSSKRLLSSEMVDIRSFIEEYRLSLSDEVYDSQEFSIKLIQVPRVSNTNRSDLAIEFVNWSQLDAGDKEKYEHLVALIKPKVIKQDVANLDRLSSGQVVSRIQELVDKDFNSHDHNCFYYIFNVHPYGFEKKEKDLYDTNPEYCLFDEPHQDYVFYETWVDFILDVIGNEKLRKEEWRKAFREKRKLSISDYQ